MALRNFTASWFSIFWGVGRGFPFFRKIPTRWKIQTNKKTRYRERLKEGYWGDESLGSEGKRHGWPIREKGRCRCLCGVSLERYQSVSSSSSAYSSSSGRRQTAREEEEGLWKQQNTIPFAEGRKMLLSPQLTKQYKRFRDFLTKEPLYFTVSSKRAPYFKFLIKRTLLTVKPKKQKTSIIPTF